VRAAMPESGFSSAAASPASKQDKEEKNSTPPHRPHDPNDICKTFVEWGYLISIAEVCRLSTKTPAEMSRCRAKGISNPDRGVECAKKGWHRRFSTDPVQQRGYQILTQRQGNRLVRLRLSRGFRLGCAS